METELLMAEVFTPHCRLVWGPQMEK